MKILISLNSGYGQTTEQKVVELNELLDDVIDSAVYPNVGMSEYCLAMTTLLHNTEKPSVLDDAIFKAHNAEDSNIAEKRRYPNVRTYEQDLSYAAFNKFKQVYRKEVKPLIMISGQFTPLKIKDSKKQLALFDRLSALHSAAQKLLIHSFDEKSKFGHHKDVRTILENENIYKERP